MQLYRAVQDELSHELRVVLLVRKFLKLRDVLDDFAQTKKVLPLGSFDQLFLLLQLLIQVILLVLDLVLLDRFDDLEVLHLNLQISKLPRQRLLVNFFQVFVDNVFMRNLLLAHKQLEQFFLA